MHSDITCIVASWVFGTSLSYIDFLCLFKNCVNMQISLFIWNNLQGLLWSFGKWKQKGTSSFQKNVIMFIIFHWRDAGKQCAATSSKSISEVFLFTGNSAQKHYIHRIICLTCSHGVCVIKGRDTSLQLEHFWGCAIHFLCSSYNGAVCASIYKGNPELVQQHLLIQC